MGIRWTRSGLVERDNNDDRAEGALAYFYVGGTTTPYTVYQDAAESVPHEHPVEADGNGRWPLVFIPYTASYDEKVTTAGGVQLSYYEEIPNPNPVEAAEDTVEAGELLETGDVTWSPIDGTIAGRVRCNGRTIGNASSGATERANADTEDLFTFLWNGLANGQAAVSTGRGASAAADYAANKTIALPDLRLGTIMGLDDMGNSAASRGGSVPFTNGDATTPGSACGENTHQLITAELPSHLHSVSITTSTDGSHTHTGTTDSGGSHTHTGTTDNQNQGHTHTFSGTTGDQSQTHVHAQSANTIHTGASANTTSTGGVQITASSENTGNASQGHTHDYSGTTSEPNQGHTHTFTTASGGAHTHTFTTASGGSHSHTVSGNTGNTGSGTAHNVVQYGVLGTFFMKL